MCICIMLRGILSYIYKIGQEIGAQSKNIVVYHRRERRVRRVLRWFQSLLVFSGASAFSVCSAANFEGIALSLKNSAVPR